MNSVGCVLLERRVTRGDFPPIIDPALIVGRRQVSTIHCLNRRLLAARYAGIAPPLKNLAST
jgi:hypothetical protein